MSPEFADAVDPIFLHVINAMEMVANHQRVDPTNLHTAVQVKLRQAEDKLQHGENHDVWQLARYALCAWIDDLMINTTWEGQKWWENHTLEFQFFNTKDAGTQFFQKAKQAQQLLRRDAIEVYYIAVVLGFRGLYALSESKFLAQQYDLPPTIEDWARRTAGLLQTRRQRTPLSGIAMPVDGAPPLDSKFTVVGAAVLTLMLCIISAIVGYYVYFGEAGGESSNVDVAAETSE
jgi:type VI secretion system protein ImpK